ncbi:hypothetical protein IW492_11980 [Enterococcus sp. BWB1-3]|uniref:hypothetical protein n=1 Tax=unclassified Enterococcus TaxID=2608891 RepID=UPI0019249E6A|nr:MULTISPECIES: hypothetical protein [unclassified Enterococcus]MBL1229952.1 hypothetical protein [Enterococcus sp. BWB1-3]MCB5952950.1 hypothetical protein [Enterococcus sp. BWT-B8]MCB5953543.1 hypothetical protein [Enterococcus sp. CWB-B31]
MSKQIKNNKEINVSLSNGFIPVNIGGLEFKLLTSDRKRKEYRQVLASLEEEQKVLLKQADELKDTSDEISETAVYEKTIKIIKKAIDTVLGKDAFNQLYEKAGEDAEAILDAFIGVMEQYRAIQEKNKLQQFVDGKKK